MLVEVGAAGRVGTGWTYGPAAVARIVADMLREVVVDRSVWDTTGSFAAMVAAIRNVGRPGVASCAISAVDTALWDLKARLLQLPLSALLGRVREEVAVYGSGGFTTYDETQLTDQLDGWVSGQQIPRVKIKIGESWGTQTARDLTRMQQARAVIGDAAELFVDANGGYRRKQAVRLMREASDLDIRWFEEPVSSDDLVGLRLVRDGVNADVTAGEYGHDLAYFQRMCDAQAVDCVQVDISRCGGITEWMRITAVVAAAGLEVSGHCAPHLHAAAAAATPNLRHLEWFHDHVRIESMLFDGTLDPSGGTIRPDAGAEGNGLTLRRTDADRYRVG